MAIELHGQILKHGHQVLLSLRVLAKEGGNGWATPATGTRLLKCHLETLAKCSL